MDYVGMNEGYRQFIGSMENPNLATRGTVQVAALAEPAFRVEEERLSRALRGPVFLAWERPALYAEEPDAIQAFGVKQITGASAMQAFFVKIDSPLNIDHRILEVWDGETEMAKKAEPEITVTAPFMWLFRRAAADGRLSSWFITAGPLKTESVL